MPDSANIAAYQQLASQFGYAVATTLIIGALALGAFGVVASYWIRARIDNQFATRRADLVADAERTRERLRHELGVIFEEVRSEHQRRLHDISLFSEQRHKIYSRLYRRLIVAQGAYSQYTSGFGERPDFSEYTAAEIEDLLVRLETGETTRRRIAALINQERSSAIRQLDEVYEVQTRRLARRQARQFRNAVVLNELYLSRGVHESLEEAWQALAKLMAFTRDERRVDWDTAAAVGRELDSSVADVRRRMYEELNPGTSTPRPLTPLPEETRSNT